MTNTFQSKTESLREVKQEFNLYRCQWLVRGHSCNAILTDDSAYVIFHANREMHVCPYHRKLNQSLKLLNAEYEPALKK